MPTQCLTRRKPQLELLALLCDDRRRAVVVPPSAARASDDISTRFLALESDGLLMEWPLRGVDDPVVVDATVTVLFEHEAQAYAFRTETYGRVWWTCPRRGPVAAWKLRLPLRIDERPARRHARVPLAEIDAVAARFTSVADPARCFTARLLNLSAGGLHASAAGGPDRTVRQGESYWVRFVLPGEEGELEFVARVAHARVNPRDGSVVFGCAFCPVDDPARRQRELGRIERFVARQRGGGAEAHRAAFGRGE